MLANVYVSQAVGVTRHQAGRAERQHFLPS